MSLNKAVNRLNILPSLWKSFVMLSLDICLRRAAAVQTQLWSYASQNPLPRLSRSTISLAPPPPHLPACQNLPHSSAVTLKCKQMSLNKLDASLLLISSYKVGWIKVGLASVFTVLHKHIADLNMETDGWAQTLKFSYSLLHTQPGYYTLRVFFS